MALQFYDRVGFNTRYQCSCGRVVTVTDRRKVASGEKTSCGICMKRTTAPPPPVLGACWIPLTQGQFALVDDQDAARINKHAWYALKNGNTWYALRNDPPSGSKIYMHHVILDTDLVDHKNGDGLDNRRANLRPCSSAQNAKNRRKIRPASSAFKGVARTKNGKWQASIYSGKPIYLGTFETEVEAATAYDRAACELHGEFARTNGIGDL